MATHERDVEAYHWEFGLFSGDSFSNPPYREGTSEPDLNHFHNICITEDEENTQASIFTQGLFEPYPCGYSLAIEGGQEEAGYIETSSSCTSHGDSSYERVYSLDITNEFSKIDSEVGRRLNQMVSIPTACFDGLPLSSELSNKGINTKLGLTAEHVPRINGEIPSIDEATTDHQRLLDRLQVYDLVERKVEGDGNCQFRALSDQLYGTQDHHDFVRKKVINQLRSQREIYEGYIPMAYDDYLEKLSKNGEWGDHVTLQAAADAYGVKIFVITSFKDTCYIEILPTVQEPKRVIFLSFWAEVHYNSIYPEGDLPAGGTKKKKWWQFGK